MTLPPTNQSSNLLDKTYLLAYLLYSTLLEALFFLPLVLALVGWIALALAIKERVRPSLVKGKEGGRG